MKEGAGLLRKTKLANNVLQTEIRSVKMKMLPCGPPKPRQRRRAPV